MIIVIPCLAEPHITDTLESLKACDPPACSTEIIIVINSPENASTEILEANERALMECNQWAIENKTARFAIHILGMKDLPAKHAGVGLARKIGMDEAAVRLDKTRLENGIIICFDADCTVDPNYLMTIYDYFIERKDINAASIYFEHPLENVSDDLDAITHYELFLRYYLWGLRYAAYPYAYHTIGSSMAVRSNTYKSQGGMNKRKAGEDFYFLHKLIPLGGFGEINDTTVYPSARPSDRVPFGTGRAIKNWRSGDTRYRYTYDPAIFDELKTFQLELLEGYSRSFNELRTRLSKPNISFLDTLDFEKVLREINENSSTSSNYKKRFLRWFDGFRVLKMVHYLRDNHYPNVELIEAATTMLLRLGKEINVPNAQKLLIRYRELDRGSDS